MARSLSGRRIKNRLVGLSGSRGFGYRVVDFQDQRFGALELALVILVLETRGSCLMM